jgi:hypothetical protein
MLCYVGDILHQISVLKNWWQAAYKECCSALGMRILSLEIDHSSQQVLVQQSYCTSSLRYIYNLMMTVMNYFIVETAAALQPQKALPCDSCSTFHQRCLSETWSQKQKINCA